MQTQMPAQLASILESIETQQFIYSSEPITGNFLAALAASKPRGRLLELGTGLGYGTAWLLLGMDPYTTLTTIDANPLNSAVAQQHLGNDKRVRFVVRDAGAWLESAPSAEFDLVFADSPEGKYAHLDDALRTLKSGGIYVVDDMRRKTDGTDEYLERSIQLTQTLRSRNDLLVTEMQDFATGIVLAIKR